MRGLDNKKLIVWKCEDGDIQDFSQLLWKEYCRTEALSENEDDIRDDPGAFHKSEESIIHKMVERENATAAVLPLSHWHMCEYWTNRVPPDFLAQSFTLSS